ncbi:MAG: DUF86 domain-containing protein [Leptolyngbya sp. SIO4C5]|nr:DUF86 domain-containing protein [Leptolyngbya sp. SIO4C5]
MADQQQIRDIAAITNMIQAIREIQEDTQGLTYETYLSQRTIRRAVERNCEIIGEAARRISSPCRSTYSTIDWSGAIGFRNVIIHQYDQVNDQEVWLIVSTLLPTLLAQLETLLSELSEAS